MDSCPLFSVCADCSLVGLCPGGIIVLALLDIRDADQSLILFLDQKTQDIR
jgi:hypothetical protein